MSLADGMTQDRTSSMLNAQLLIQHIKLVLNKVFASPELCLLTTVNNPKNIRNIAIIIIYFIVNDSNYNKKDKQK